MEATVSATRRTLLALGTTFDPETTIKTWNINSGFFVNIKVRVTLSDPKTNSVLLMLFKVVQRFSFVKSPSTTIQMKVTYQIFPVLLFTMLCKVMVPTFESVDEVLKCNQ